MTKSFRWVVLGLLLLFGAFVALEYNRPRPLDWSLSFANNDKIPYGTFVLYDQLPRLLGTDSVREIRVPIYSQLTGEGEAKPQRSILGISIEDSVMTDEATPNEDNSEESTASGDSASAENETAESTASDDNATAETTAQDSAAQAPAVAEGTTSADGNSDENSDDDIRRLPETAPTLRPGLRANYLIVKQYFEADGPDTRALLEFVRQGNDVFIAAEDFGAGTHQLGDTLGLRTELPDTSTRAALAARDSIAVRFTHPALAGPTYRLPPASGQFFRFIRPRPGRVLATDAQGRPVYVRMDFGAGHFYLCSVPLAFTNYFVLKPNTRGFAEGALRYLPARPVWWDEFSKRGRSGDQSRLRLIFDHAPLRLAWYVLLAGVVLFVFFEARRRQRIIPTIKPLPNTTLLFASTVAGLYRQGGSHSPIAEKKVALFLDFLRTRFQENAPDLGDDAFRQRLSQKSGLARPRVDELLRLVNFARTAPVVNDRELATLSRALNDFKREAR